jgi:hypothetical protein
MQVCEKIIFKTIAVGALFARGVFIFCVYFYREQSRFVETKPQGWPLKFGQI